MVDNRLQRLNGYARAMAEYNISRNPLREPVVLIFVKSWRDQYRDQHTMEVGRVLKYAAVSRNVDIDYVQELGGDLLQIDNERQPYIVSLTDSDLPRLPQQGDRVLYDGVLYSVAKVKPFNRQINSLIQLIVYPERAMADPMRLYDVRVLAGDTLQPIEPSRLSEGEQVVLEFAWGGAPTLYTVDGWQTSGAFAPRVKVAWRAGLQVELRDDAGVTTDAVGVPYRADYEEGI